MKHKLLLVIVALALGGCATTADARPRYKTCPDGSRIRTSQTCPAPAPTPAPTPTPTPTPVPEPTPAPAPCPAGTALSTAGHCEPIPAPAPEPTPTPVPAPIPAPTPDPAPTLGGAPAIASNFDIYAELVTTGFIPGSASPDVLGAFRFICNAGQVLRDDPIVYPGQAGKSHLHQFYGNTGANANSTYESLRTSGQSTCMSPLNRSAYWMPAMLDGKGNVVRPDFVSIYYKRRPKTDPVCSDSGNPQYQGKCVNLPNGLKFIFGFDFLTLKSPTGFLKFNCQGPGSVPGVYKTIPEAAANCPAGAQLGAIIEAPDCWDGKNLDSANHRDHVAYASYGDWGYFKCPSTHPYVIPTFTLGAWFTSDANVLDWRLASDDMFPNLPHGTTFHADFWMAWDPFVHQIWEDNCLDKKLNCSGGQLGNGQEMKQFSGFTWKANPRLVPVP